MRGWEQCSRWHGLIACGDNVFDTSKMATKRYIYAGELEDLHKDHLVKTVTKQPGDYKGSPGVSTFVVGQKKAHGKAVEKGGGRGDNLEKYSREELLQLLW